MTDIPAELVIRQSLRSLVHEIVMGALTSRDEDQKRTLFKQTSENPLKSPVFLKALFESPSENIGKILDTKNECSSEQPYTHEQKSIIVSYLQEINKLKPQPVRDWNTLRHYLYYVYRHFVTPKPGCFVPPIPAPVLREIRDLVESLLMEDTTQLFLRLFAQIREFITLTVELFLSTSTMNKFENLEPNNGLEQMCFVFTKMSKIIWILRKYYNVLCLTADMLVQVLPEFNELLLRKYSISWTLFNKAMFYFYFYRTPVIRKALMLFEKMYPDPKLSQDEEVHAYYKFKEELQSLEQNWSSIIEKIVEGNENMSFRDLKFRDRLDKMFDEHKKILNTNFWITRTLREKLTQARDELGTQLILWVGDKDNISGKLLNLKGQCICEECILADYGHDKKNGRISLKLSKKNWDEMKTDDVDFDGSFECISPVEDLDEKSFLQLMYDAPEIDRIFTAISKLDAATQKSSENISSSILTELTAKANVQVEKEDVATQQTACPGKQKEVAKKCFPDPDTLVENVKTATKLSQKRKEVNKKMFPDVDQHTKAAEKTKAIVNSKVNAEESLKRDVESQTDDKKPCLNGCDFHKESRRCDCTYCEVFGNSVSVHAHKSNETRDRLRTRLNQRKEKVKKSETAENDKEKKLQRTESIYSMSTVSLNSCGIGDQRDIDELLKFIEGRVGQGGEDGKKDRLDLCTDKKAAKKARQKMKKEEERMKVEEDARRKAEEERKLEEARKEEERRAAEELAKQQAEKERRARKEEKKKSKKKQQNEQKHRLIEETIPAMVTIKRVVENNSTPTVTITLKGSTPDQDKLLYTLVNGYSNNSEKKEQKPAETKVVKKKKKKAEVKEPEKTTKSKQKQVVVEEMTKEVKLLLAVDKVEDTKKSREEKKPSKPPKKPVIEKKEEVKKPPPKMLQNKDHPDLNIPMLRLPPGITITKVDGPVASRNYRPGNNAMPISNHQQGNVPVSKSGVIVVDTEKLIRQSVEREQNKKKKKKNKKPQDQKEDKPDAAPMVTLKNPIFHTLQTTLANKEKLMPNVPVIPCNQQASIIKNDNGMVTIRSPRLQQTMGNGAPCLLSELKPVMGADISFVQHTNEPTHISPFNAQEILSGLPGIEITKVDRNAVKSDTDRRSTSCQAADVSIIPTSNGERFALDRDDWQYESVFAPKDILEDDLDAEERELEAFKRFCQQSVPPKRKEKVAHLNVKDIIFNKKKDVSFV